MRTALIELLGLALLAAAGALVAVPLGVAVAGAECLFVARQIARGGGR